ncbi:acylsugar acyltransferase 3-like [Rutidosis leptorrhynchoides]|uniref:acylsugar acyltransferase 3-like n=1 Tax=Rutidosis leptorrhynchoides TaxID=125765 RepID=UPI003A99ED27
MLTNFFRFGRRQLHTIISREIIKPSSPTPPHPRVYNLSELDLLNTKAYMPLILFYPNANHNHSLSDDEKGKLLKKSLSQSLTRYYPFAGKFSTNRTYIDCNDNGVVFVEATNDNQLDTFQRMSAHDDTLDQLFADGVRWYNNISSTNVLAIQLNHFSCGGVAVAISLSHLIADGSSLGSFLSYWACIALHGSTNHKHVLELEPYFINSVQSPEPAPAPAPDSTTASSAPDRGTCPISDNNKTNFVGKKFVFPNSKLSDLKNQVAVEVATNGSALPKNVYPTRIEVLTSLIYKTATAAATKRTGCFKPYYLLFMFNMRDKFVKKLPQTTIGNFVLFVMIPSIHRSETASLATIVTQLKKEKLQVEGIENVQQVVENVKSLRAKLENPDLENFAKGSYWCSSFCGFPFNKLDFGWGKPMGITLALNTKNPKKNGFVLMDTPFGDGIEAFVTLEKECMDIFENDKELLSFCQIN